MSGFGVGDVTAGCDISHAYKAIMSTSLVLANEVKGNTGYSAWPSREMPSRMARSNAWYDHPPKPVCTSGVMLVAYTVPNGVAMARPPALGMPSSAVWQPAQLPKAANC